MREDQIENEVEGTLEKIVYRDDLSGWCVLRLSEPESCEIITATGMFVGVQPGERLRIWGKWTDSPDYGRQLHMDSYVSLSPRTLDGIQRYLASGLIDGIGEEMSRRLVGAFGLDLLEIMDSHPQRLTEVAGIGRVRAGKITRAWRQHREIKEIMIFLQSHGIPAGYAARIIRAYGKKAMTVITENPYRLCRDVFGIGFKTADKIAGCLGVDTLSPQRARAGLLYVLGTFCEKGHMCYPCGALVEEAEGILRIPPSLVQEALEALRSEEQVVVEQRGTETLVYLKALHDAEAGIACILQKFLDAEARSISLESASALSWFESRGQITLAPEQRHAITAAIEKKALVVTGGPGTGKTTLIKGIISIFEREGSRIHLCAPTGRAAKRMSEATGRDAMTIHRLFEFTPASMARGQEPARELKTDVLIIDEASMMDTVLFYHVLKGLSPHARLILVGDADQLPSVGPGNVLDDIISSGLVETIRLERIFRQAKKSLIVVNAHRINKGLMPYQASPQADPDYFFIARDRPEDVLDVVKELVSVRIPQRFGFDPVTDIQVLSPMHRGILGVANLNAELQRLLNSSGKALSRGSLRLCQGDKVMQIRNNYDLGVFNGDTGKIACVDAANKMLDVDFDGRRLRYESEDLDELTLAYACSIHKAQGNEYPAVVVVLHTQHYIMLQRNLLYTAVTRGKSLVVVVGNTKALAIATAGMTRAQRYTMLAERLRNPC